MASLSQILSDTLEILDYDSGAANVEVFQPKLLPFINEAIADLGDTLRLYAEETANIVSGEIDLDTLSRRVKRVISVKRNNTEYKFYYGQTQRHIRFYNVTDGAVTIRYRYFPASLTSDTDSPSDLPEEAQALIPNYVAGREQATKDTSQQSRANFYMNLYRDGKKRLARDYGQTELSQIRHKFR